MCLIPPCPGKGSPRPDSAAGIDVLLERKARLPDVRAPERKIEIFEARRVSEYIVKLGRQRSLIIHRAHDLWEERAPGARLFAASLFDSGLRGLDQFALTKRHLERFFQS